MRTAPPLLAPSAVIIAVAATMGHFFTDAFTTLLGPLGPDLQKVFGLTLTQVAFLSSVMSLTSSVLQPVLGVATERFDRRLMLAIGPTLAGVGLCLMPYMPSFAFLVALVALSGIGSGILHPSGSAYVSDYSPAEKRGLWASLFSAGGTAGMALGPVLVVVLGLQGLPYMIPLIILIGVGIYFSVPSIHTQKKKATIREYLKVFQGPIRKLWGMAVLRSLTSIGYNGLLPFLLKSRGFGDREMALSLGIYAIASAIGGIVGGRLSDKYGRVKVLRSSLLGLIPLYILLFYSTPTDLWYYPLTFIVGGLTNATIPVGVVAAQEYAPNHVALASSIMMGFSWGVSGLLFTGIGGIADHFGIMPALWVSVFMLIPSMFLVYNLPEPMKLAQKG